MREVRGQRAHRSQFLEVNSTKEGLRVERAREEKQKESEAPYRLCAPKGGCLKVALSSRALLTDGFVSLCLTYVRSHHRSLML